MSDPPIKGQAVRNITNPVDVLGSILGDVSTMLGAIGAISRAVSFGPLLEIVTGFIGGTFGAGNKAIEHLRKNPTDIAGLYGVVTSDAGYPFIEAFSEGALGINPLKQPAIKDGLGMVPPKDWQVTPSTFEVDASPGWNELARMTGFIILANVVSAGINLVGKTYLADRWSEALEQGLGLIGEHLGLSWASGTALSELFRAAAMPAIVEQVNVEKRPNRLDMMLLRQLARQHHITTDQFWSALSLQGYPDNLKALILQLDTQQLPVQDLQALWSIGIMDRDNPKTLTIPDPKKPGEHTSVTIPSVSTYLQHLGFSDTDVQLLLTLWIDNAQTQEVSQFRATLRADYLQGKITVHQFQSMLAQLMTNPQKPPDITKEWALVSQDLPAPVQTFVAMAVASANFTNQYGRAQLGIAQLGKLLKTGEISQGEFVQRAKQYGYERADALKLAAQYQLPPMAGKPGLTSAKVLQYAASGTLTPEDAYVKLLDLGMDAKDAGFLAWNPSAKVGILFPPGDINTAHQGYLDGVLSNEQATTRLEQLGVSEPQRKALLELWYHQKHLGLLTSPKAIKEEAGWEQRFRDSLQSLYNSGAIGDAQLINLFEETGMTGTDAGWLWASWYAAKHNAPPGEYPAGQAMKPASGTANRA